jgi:hypothetical protein
VANLLLFVPVLIFVFALLRGEWRPVRAKTP